MIHKHRIGIVTVDEALKFIVRDISSSLFEFTLFEFIVRDMGGYFSKRKISTHASLLVKVKL